MVFIFTLSNTKTLSLTKERFLLAIRTIFKQYLMPTHIKFNFSILLILLFSARSGSNTSGIADFTM